MQHHLVRAQAEDHCRRRRRCQRCGAAHQGQAVPACFVFVRYRECFRAPVRAMPLRCDPPPDPGPGQRDHARPVHTRVRAGYREDGSFAAVSSCPNTAVGVLAARRHTFGGDGAATHDPCGCEAGKGSSDVREGGGTNLGGDEIDRAFQGVTRRFVQNCTLSRAATADLLFRKRG